MLMKRNAALRCKYCVAVNVAVLIPEVGLFWIWKNVQHCSPVAYFVELELCNFIWHRPYVLGMIFYAHQHIRRKTCHSMSNLRLLRFI